MDKVEKVLNNLEPLRLQLLNHDLYKYIETVDDLRIFTQYHVFAVWDFMSLVKILQQKLTCVNVPWVPKPSPEYTYLINDIVLAEESDINKDGQRQSHFQLYLQAMSDINASRKEINQFTSQIQHGTDVFLVISASDLPNSVKSFLIFTFNTIYNKELHHIASTFTFGREELIPDMFSGLIDQIQQKFPEENIANLKYYFERHIEIDADVHGPMAINLLKDLCQNDETKWIDVETISKKALKKRIKLWDGILNKIMINKSLA